MTNSCAVTGACVEKSKDGNKKDRYNSPKSNIPLQETLKKAQLKITSAKAIQLLYCTEVLQCESTIVECQNACESYTYIVSVRGERFMFVVEWERSDVQHTSYTMICICPLSLPSEDIC